MSKAIDEFYKCLHDGKRLADSTLKSYQRDIESFSTFCGGNLLRVKPENISDYVSVLYDEGKANSTVARTVSSLKSFYNFLFENGKIKVNPVAGLRAPKIGKKLPVILTADEVTKLLSVPDDRGFKGLRDKAMLELLYATGIKVSELVSLNLSSINLKRRILFCSSNNNVRVIPVGKEAIKALKAYINDARSLCTSNIRESALFVNCSGTRMTRQGFWKIIKKYKEIAGIEKEITPHMLRHSFAAHMVENGADLVSMGELMGLSDSASTAIYQKVVENKIFEVYRKAHPRA